MRRKEKKKREKASLGFTPARATESSFITGLTTLTFQEEHPPALTL